MDTNKIYEKKARWELYKNAVQNKSWKQRPTKQQLYGHSPPILQAIQVRQIRCGALLEKLR